ncbi:MAG TPA: hypothetical protein EYP39_01875, partial [Ghiorsea sp.]|nr:hypothetical protein [Ghiorsea sp.]
MQTNNVIHKSVNLWLSCLGLIACRFCFIATLRTSMKKTFNLIHPKTKYARLVDAVRSDIKRYI